MATEFIDKAQILADIWANYREDPDFEDFISYNDLGLPLAFALCENIIKRSTELDLYIEETFSLLLKQLEIEDTGFEDLDEMLDS